MADLDYIREHAGRLIDEPQTDDVRWAQVSLDRFAYAVLRLVKEHERLLAGATPPPAHGRDDG